MFARYGANLQLVIQVANRYSDFLTTEKIISLFKQFDSWSSLFSSQHTDVISKCIQAAQKVGQYAQVKICEYH